MIEKQRMVVAGRGVDAIVYNGSFPAPTLVASPGDRMDIRLVNRLDEHDNLHTHGFHVQPDGKSDNVFLHPAPGETFDFRIDLPRNHAPGLNWYHPHVHGSGTQQIFGGAAGAIVIRGEHDRTGTRHRMRDRVLVLQTPEWEGDGRHKAFAARPAEVAAAAGQRAAQPDDRHPARRGAALADRQRVGQHGDDGRLRGRAPGGAVGLAREPLRRALLARLAATGIAAGRTGSASR